MAAIETTSAALAAAPRRVLYIQYTNPGAYPPLEHSAHILARAGAAVRMLGVASPYTAGLALAGHPRVAVTLRPYAPPGPGQKAHYLRFCAAALALAAGWRPDWVYVSDPLAAPAGLLLGALPGARLLYHEHDSPNPGPHSRFMAFVLACRRRLARRAALALLPNQERAAAFRRDTGAAPPLVVWNCPRLAEVAPPRAGAPAPGLLLLYHGSLVPERLPLAVLDALARLPDAVRLRVVGYETIGSQGYAARLRARAAELGLAARLELIGGTSRAALLALARDADLGLALLPVGSPDVNLAAMVGASNKVFDYASAGAALLVSALPAWRAAYVDPGYGLACDPRDPESIAAALRWCLAHRAELRAMGERGRRQVLAEWNYERQFAPALERMRALAPRPAR